MRSVRSDDNPGMRVMAIDLLTTDPDRELAGVLQELGRIEDEALARALLFGRAQQRMKLDVVQALEHDAGAWVIPLLGEVLAGDNRELRSQALDVLESRAEPEARSLAERHLFERLERPPDRLRRLVARADKAAFETLARALADERAIMRAAALDQFHARRNPQLCGADGRRLLRTFQPKMTRRLEIERYVYALLSTEPIRAVHFVRENWNALPSDSMRATALQVLQETRGRRAREAAIDLALEKATADAPTQLLLQVGAVLKGQWRYRRDEVAAFWQRCMDAGIRSLRWATVRALAYPDAPDVSQQLLALLQTTVERSDPDDEDDLVDRQAFVQLIVKALRYQPATRVESALIDIVLEPLNTDGARSDAATALLGRVSEAGRERLLAWLCVDDPGADAKAAAPGTHASLDVQALVAAALEV